MNTPTKILVDGTNVVGYPMNEKNRVVTQDTSFDKPISMKSIQLNKRASFINRKS